LLVNELEIWRKTMIRSSW